MQTTTQLPIVTELLNSPKPVISECVAGDVAQKNYGLLPQVISLTGERDCNFLATSASGANCVLKFVNASEPEVETQFQIALLRHLDSQGMAAMAPKHLVCGDSGDYLLLQDEAGRDCRVRSYTYLHGMAAVKAKPSAAQRRAVGSALGQFDRALRGFEHPGMQRDFLWNLMQLGRLKPLVIHIDDSVLRNIASEFIAAFEASISTALSGMRQQAIHNDLSKSNYLVQTSDHNSVAGILDFGDVVIAPLVCDPAIAASYQMVDAEDPLAAIEELLEGYMEQITLTEDERRHVLDLVLARVVQRLVLTEWRAAMFPENRGYILRHNPDARRLAMLLAPVWRRQSHHALRITP